MCNRPVHRGSCLSIADDAVTDLDQTAHHVQTHMTSINHTEFHLSLLHSVSAVSTDQFKQFR